jgi:hypothetical protein
MSGRCRVRKMSGSRPVFVSGKCRWILDYIGLGYIGRASVYWIMLDYIVCDYELDHE